LATLETGNKYEKKLYLKSEEKKTVLRGFLQKAQQRSRREFEPN